MLAAIVVGRTRRFAGVLTPDGRPEHFTNGMEHGYATSGHHKRGLVQACFRVIRALEVQDRDEAGVVAAVRAAGGTYGTEALVFVTDTCWQVAYSGTERTGEPLLGVVSSMAVDGELDMLGRGEGDTDQPWRGQQ